MIHATFSNFCSRSKIAESAEFLGMHAQGSRDRQARSQGGVGGVPTPPSGINDIHNTNYLIQERLFDCF